MINNGERQSLITTSGITPDPDDPGTRPPDDPQGQKDKTSRENKCRPRLPYLVEPLAILYSFSTFGFVSLNSEYVYSRIRDSSNDTLLYEQGYSAYYSYNPYTAPFAAKYTTHASDDYYNYTTIYTGDPEDYDDWKVTLEKMEGYISSKASVWVMYLSLARGIPPIVTILLILTYTDVNGRKLGLVLPTVGGMIRALTYTVVEWHQLPLSCLVIGKNSVYILQKRTKICNIYTYN